MNIAALVRMANQIAAAIPAPQSLAPEAAAPAVADHMRRFWEPRMRAALAAHAMAGGAGLTPAARTAALLASPDPSP